jgi:hypothetical protein
MLKSFKDLLSVRYKLNVAGDYANYGYGGSALAATCATDACPGLSEAAANFDGVNDVLQVPSGFSLGGPIDV